MDKTINYVISKLKVISKLQSGNKLMIEDNRINIMECDKNSWDRFIKWWLGETRQSTIDKLQSFYMEIKDMITILAIHSSENQNTLTRLSTELSSSIRGLNNLMLTYTEDRTITSQLETLSENFQLEVSRINTILSPYKTPTPPSPHIPPTPQSPHIPPTPQSPSKATGATQPLLIDIEYDNVSHNYDDMDDDIYD
jgi:hypothetical protein